MTTLTSTLYLASNSLINAPMNIATSNKNNLSWNVDWENLFRGRTGLCKVYINLVSSNTTTTALNSTAWDALIGTIRVNFSSSFSNTNNGVIVANVLPNSIANSTTNFYFSATTESGQAPTINIPTGKQLINIKFTDTTEIGYIAGITDYYCVVTFEHISPETVQKNIS